MLVLISNGHGRRLLVKPPPGPSNARRAARAGPNQLRAATAMAIAGSHAGPHGLDPGPVCVEKSLSLSALIGDIDDVRSLIFHRLEVAISTIRHC